jgi:hypothetical protein
VDDNFGMNFAKIMSEEVWQNNDENTLFKMGEIVKYRNEEVKIIGVNRISKKDVEYALENYQFLVFENELEKIKCT